MESTEGLRHMGTTYLHKEQIQGNTHNFVNIIFIKHNTWQWTDTGMGCQNNRGKWTWEAGRETQVSASNKLGIFPCSPAWSLQLCLDYNQDCNHSPQRTGNQSWKGSPRIIPAQVRKRDGKGTVAVTLSEIDLYQCQVHTSAHHGMQGNLASSNIGNLWRHASNNAHGWGNMFSWCCKTVLDKCPGSRMLYTCFQIAPQTLSIGQHMAY